MIIFIGYTCENAFNFTGGKILPSKDNRQWIAIISVRSNSIDSINLLKYSTYSLFQNHRGIKMGKHSEDANIK